MLIHSVTPVHMLTPQTEIQAPSFKQMGQSFLEGVETKNGFQLARIHSTDPAMYLRGDLSPGNLYKQP